MDRAKARNAGSSSSLRARRPSSSAKRGSKSGLRPARTAAVASFSEREGDALGRLPAIERVAVVADEEEELAPSSGRYGHGPARRSRGRARARACALTPSKTISRSSAVEMDHPIRRHGVAGFRIAQVLAVRTDQAEGDRDRASAASACLSGVSGRSCFSRSVRRSFSRSYLCATVTVGVPACSYQSVNCAEVDAARVGEAGDEILDRRGLAVMALEVEIHAGAETVAAEQVCSMRQTSAPFS